MAKYSYDLVVIGGGSAGLALAGITAYSGMKIALVEMDRLGGECLHDGCVPSKALLAAAHLVHRSKHADRLGLPQMKPGAIDLGQVMDRVAGVVDQIQVHDSPEVLRSWGVAEFIHGRARFLDSNSMEIDGEGGPRQITAERFAICTGSNPRIPELPGLSEVEYWTNDNLFHQRVLPGRLAVLGGGPIGCEMGQAFSRLGSEVVLYEQKDRILPMDDPESSALLQTALEGEGISIRTGSRVETVERLPGGIRIQSTPGDAHEPVVVDELLVAVGRSPAVQDLNLEAAGVRYSSHGVEVDHSLRTTARNIWCLGDANGSSFFSHAAEAEARSIATSILFSLPSRMDYSNMPWATFTDPEVAHAGLSERDARARFGDVSVLRFPFSRVDRALADGDASGFIKIMTRGWRGRVIGAEIVAPGAGELIHEWILAIKSGASVSQVSGLVHVYPSLSMASQRVADRFFEESPWARMAARFTRALFRFRRRDEVDWREGSLQERG